MLSFVMVLLNDVRLNRLLGSLVKFWEGNQSGRFSPSRLHLLFLTAVEIGESRFRDSLSVVIDGMSLSSPARNSYEITDLAKFFLDPYSREDLDAGVEKGGSPFLVTVGVNVWLSPNLTKKLCVDAIVVQFMLTHRQLEQLKVFSNRVSAESNGHQVFDGFTISQAVNPQALESLKGLLAKDLQIPMYHYGFTLEGVVLDRDNNDGEVWIVLVKWAERVLGIALVRFMPKLDEEMGLILMQLYGSINSHVLRGRYNED